MNIPRAIYQKRHKINHYCLIHIQQHIVIHCNIQLLHRQAIFMRTRCTSLFCMGGICKHAFLFLVLGWFFTWLIFYLLQNKCQIHALEMFFYEVDILQIKVNLYSKWLINNWPHPLKNTSTEQIYLRVHKESISRVLLSRKILER